MINEVLRYYDFINPNAELIGHSENMTYKVIDSDKCYQLRIHKPVEGFDLELVRRGLKTNDLIISEMEILLYLAKKESLRTQKVILNKQGNAITTIDGDIFVTVLEWINGVELNKIEITNTIAHNLGIMLGKLHNELANKIVNNRYCLDDRLVSVLINEVLEASKQGYFTDRQASAFVDTLSCIRDYFVRMKHNFRLIHADFNFSNVLFYDNNVIPIDFSLSGYCIPEMDLAMGLSKLKEVSLKANMLDGYQTVCNHKPDDTGITVCSCFSSLLFVVTQYKRFASESWFKEKIEVWCERDYIPLTKRS